MNKLLVSVFDSEMAAEAGLKALRSLHAAGDITLYATGVVASDAKGVVSVKKSMDPGPVGTVTGLAVGSLIGLLGGPAGIAIGALTGTLVGALVKLQVKLAAARHSLDGAVHRAKERGDALKQEADAKAEALKLQLNQAQGDVKVRIEDRVKRVKSAYHARGAKLSQAWSLAKEALAA